MEITIFISCSLVGDYQHIGGNSRLHVQGSGERMERQAVRFSGLSVIHARLYDAITQQSSTPIAIFCNLCSNGYLPGTFTTVLCFLRWITELTCLYVG
jgi:hypothetical protein